MAAAAWRSSTAADEMNTAAANALLKLLEEPPARRDLPAGRHQPARLLPTIRSRCRELRLSPLSPDDLAHALAQAGGDVQPEDRAALAELAGGSVGEAIRLTNLDGLALYARSSRCSPPCPGWTARARLASLAEAAAARRRTTRVRPDPRR